MTSAATLSSRTSFDSFSSSTTARRHYIRLQKNTGKEDYGKTTWASSDKPKELEPRFEELKKRLVRLENYAAVQASWDRLLVALDKKAVEIAEIGPDVRFYL